MTTNTVTTHQQNFDYHMQAAPLVWLGYVNPNGFGLRALEYIEEDELVEVTPTQLWLRKATLKEVDRRRAYSVAGQAPPDNPVLKPHEQDK